MRRSSCVRLEERIPRNRRYWRFDVIIGNPPYIRGRLEKEIVETDAKIYELVFDLYGLTDDELKIVENATKD